MTSISMAGPSKTVSRHKRLKVPTAVKFGNGSNIPHGMKFTAGSGAHRYKSRKGSHEDSTDPGSSSDSEEFPEEERHRCPSKKGSGKVKRKPREDSSSSDSTSTSASSPESEPEMSSDETPSSSSTTSDDSESDLDRRRSHKRKCKSHKSTKQKGGKKKSRKWRKESRVKREERKMLAKQKVDPPGTYDRRPDLAVFDKWTYEVNTWIRLTKYHKPTALNLLVKYTTGTAGKFFMSFIARCEDTWSVRAMYEALFDYCFLPDFKDRLHTQLSNASQRQCRIRDFVRDIEKLASCFPDVNEQAMIQAFWNGIHQSIHLRLIEWGISPEHTSLEQIVRKAISIEASEDAYNREVRANTKVGPPKREWGRFPNRVTGPKLYRPVEEGSGPSQSRRND